MLESIELVSVGNRHGFAYNKQQNKLYSWGFNLYGQANPTLQGDIQPQLLSQLPLTSELIDIGCGFFHSVLLLK
jgi:alpha-tubulin suppressor-like RCC1 family protein